MICCQVMIRRLKKDVLTELPPKVRQRVVIEVKPTQLKKLTSAMATIDGMGKKMQIAEEMGDGK